MSITGTLSASARAKLAAEIEQSRPITEWDSVPELKKWKEELIVKGKKETFTFDELVLEYKRLGKEIDTREALRKEIRTAVGAGLLVSGEDQLACEGFKIQMVERKGSRKVDELKLLEHGVSASTIAACTVIGKSSQFVDIREMKSQDE